MHVSPAGKSVPSHASPSSSTPLPQSDSAGFSTQPSPAVLTTYPSSHVNPHALATHAATPLAGASQSVPASHRPSAPQAKIAASSHLESPATHSTQAPSRHTGVSPVQSLEVTHVPFWHTSTESSAQRVSPCSASSQPTGAPQAATPSLTIQTSSASHDTDSPQIASSVHVASLSPSQRVAPGSQPTIGRSIHAILPSSPAAHSWFSPHALPAPQCPSEPHVTSALPSHFVAPASHSETTAPSHIPVLLLHVVPASHVLERTQFPP